MKRKGRTTVKIQEMIDWSNAQLKRTDGFATQDFKMGICSMLERFLLDNKTYDGFMYYDVMDGSREYDRLYS